MPSSHDSKPPTEALGPTLCGLGCGRLGLCPVTGAMEEQPPEAQEAAPQKRQRKEPGAGEHLLSPSPQRQALGRALPQLRAGSGETHRSMQSARLSVSPLALPLPACDPQQVPEFPPLEMGMTKVVSLQGGGGTQRKRRHSEPGTEDAGEPQRHPLTPAVGVLHVASNLGLVLSPAPHHRASLSLCPLRRVISNHGVN